ncbi:MAG: 23S rRNA (pseudouridine(1915)-N(3))-methyltransferase RlmH [Candidatus Woesearchaeota archaeon]|jgi:23S rRNA (pseudouridine1915-N3)-methyltransferase
MKITILCVGKIKEKYLDDGVKEFLKRLSAFCDVSIIELKDEGLKKESLKISEYLSSTTFLLDELGKEYSSKDFSKLFNSLEGEITFVIGGHDGISEDLKKEKKIKLLSLSKMTLTHEMARLFLIEQIYRGFMILNNRKYHR